MTLLDMSSNKDEIKAPETYKEDVLMDHEDLGPSGSEKPKWSPKEDNAVPKSEEEAGPPHSP